MKKSMTIFISALLIAALLSIPVMFIYIFLLIHTHIKGHQVVKAKVQCI